jgi:thiol:disulfide interchange protein
MPFGWYEGASGYESAVAETRDDHRPMIVYFRTDWCPYCRQLESELLRTGPVVDYLQSVVKVRINPEAGAGENEIARRYGVTGYPSVFLHRPAESSFVKLPTHIQEDDGWRLRSPDELVAACRGVFGG